MLVWPRGEQRGTRSAHAPRAGLSLPAARLPGCSPEAAAGAAHPGAGSPSVSVPLEKRAGTQDASRPSWALRTAVGLVPDSTPHVDHASGRLASVHLCGLAAHHLGRGREGETLALESLTGMGLFESLLGCCWVGSNSLQPHELQQPGFPVFHCLPESAQTHVHWVRDATQPSLLLPPSSPFALSLSQYQGLFQWVNSSHQVAKALELQLQSFKYSGFCAHVQNCSSPL